MKKITLVLSALMLCVIVNAQQQVATLVHEGNVRVFYGSYAFVDAHRAATSGDVINLSSGVFDGCNITKNITLRGAGWKGAESTIIDDAVHLKIPSRDTVSCLYIEGIYFGNDLFVDSAMNAPSIVRCFIKTLLMYEDFGTMANCVASDVTFRSSVSATFVNSILCRMSCSNYVIHINAINCFCTSSVTNSSYSPYYGRYDNCIFVNYSDNITMQSSAIANNCVYCGTNTFFFSRYGSNNETTTLATMFEDYSNISDSYYNEAASFELTETAKTQYLGNDGTEVGIYGGLVPFSEQPSFPRITKMQVGKKTTADGKLSVDIEVTSAE